MINFDFIAQWAREEQDKNVTTFIDRISRILIGISDDVVFSSFIRQPLESLLKTLNRGDAILRSSDNPTIDHFLSVSILKCLIYKYELKLFLDRNRYTIDAYDQLDSNIAHYLVFDHEFVACYRNKIFLNLISDKKFTRLLRDEDFQRLMDNHTVFKELNEVKSLEQSHNIFAEIIFGGEYNTLRTNSDFRDLISGNNFGMQDSVDKFKNQSAKNAPYFYKKLINETNRAKPFRHIIVNSQFPVLIESGFLETFKTEDKLKLLNNETNFSKSIKEKVSYLYKIKSNGNKGSHSEDVIIDQLYKSKCIETIFWFARFVYKQLYPERDLPALGTFNLQAEIKAANKYKQSSPDNPPKPDDDTNPIGDDKGGKDLKEDEIPPTKPTDRTFGERAKKWLLHVLDTPLTYIVIVYLIFIIVGSPICWLFWGVEGVKTYGLWITLSHGFVLLSFLGYYLANNTNKVISTCANLIWACFLAIITLGSTIIGRKIYKALYFNKNYSGFWSFTLSFICCLLTSTIVLFICLYLLYDSDLYTFWGKLNVYSEYYNGQSYPLWWVIGSTHAFIQYTTIYDISEDPYK